MADAVRKQQERRRLWRSEGRTVHGAFRRSNRRSWLDHRGADLDRPLHRTMARSCASAPASSGARHCWCWALRSASGRPGDGCTGNDEFPFHATRVARTASRHLVGRRRGYWSLAISWRCIGMSGCLLLAARRSCRWRLHSGASCFSPACLPPSPVASAALPLLLAAAGILAARTAAVRLGAPT